MADSDCYSSIVMNQVMSWDHALLNLVGRDASVSSLWFWLFGFLQNDRMVYSLILGSELHILPSDKGEKLDLCSGWKSIDFWRLSWIESYPSKHVQLWKAILKIVYLAYVFLIYTLWHPHECKRFGASHWNSHCVIYGSGSKPFLPMRPILCVKKKNTRSTAQIKL